MNTIVAKNNNLKKHVEELESYLKKLDINEVAIELEVSDHLNSYKNDVYSINFANKTGKILGKNSISLLNGIYRFLYECGVRWIRPTIDGEYIPNIDSIPDMNFISEASFGHRGICIEGAVSLEHVKDLIDWSAKVGMNSYFTQFRQSHTFFDRWYSHLDNNSVKKEHITIGQADQFIKEIITEIKSRGMQYHAVGHGWTCEPFGYSGLGWDQVDYEPKEEDQIHLALVNGKRDFWNKLPINTNLCYSNKDTRNLVNNDILKYLKENSAIDVLHFWLADDCNNQCECENCIKMRPSDFYVKMLNELDELLTKNNINTKIVFLVYVDLLWAPENYKIKNPDRFIIMFAPITRSYAESFATAEPEINLPDFTRNKLTMPKSVNENLGHYFNWLKDYKGDSFVFDYHLMWYYAKDQSLMNISKVISEDIKSYKRLKLNGLISCQVQRIFLPTSLPMYVMAMNLWNESLSYKDIEEDYFKSSFGINWREAKDYLNNLSKLFNPSYLDPEISKTKEAEHSFQKASELINKFLPTLEIYTENDVLCHSKSWELLKVHGELCYELSLALVAFIKNKKKDFDTHYKNLTEIAESIDIEYSHYFDIWGFINIYKLLFKDYLNN